jgi:hypothetical protein
MYRRHSCPRRLSASSGSADVGSIRLAAQLAAARVAPARLPQHGAEAGVVGEFVGDRLLAVGAVERLERLGHRALIALLGGPVVAVDREHLLGVRFAQPLPRSPALLAAGRQRSPDPLDRPQR